MVSDLDIYRSAQLMIDQHGEDASVHAAMRADELLDQGYREGADVWLRVIDAIKIMELKEAQGAVH